MALVVKNPPANAGRHKRCVGSIPELQRSPGQGNGSPLQFPCLENPLDRGGWRATIHGVTQSWAQLKQLSKHACIRIESTFILACVYPVILAPLFEKCFSLIKLSWHPCWHLLFFPCMQSEAHYTVLHPWGFLFEDIIFPSNYYMLLYQDFP